MFERLRRLHPAVILAVLAVIGLAISAYLGFVEAAGGVPSCGPLHGCETVAASEYSRIAGVPVAFLGLGFGVALLVAAIGWYRTGDRRLLAAHYGLSLAGVVFEVYLTYLQLFEIHAVCVWCASFGLTVVLGFVVALVAWLRHDRAEPDEDW
jgi:uncharacterized membrane protein